MKECLARIAMRLTRGGIDALTDQEACGARTQGEAGTAALLSPPVSENPRQARGNSTGRGVKLHGHLKERLGLEVVTAPRCATSMSLATICGCLGPGQNAKMKSNAGLS